MFWYFLYSLFYFIVYLCPCTLWLVAPRLNFSETETHWLGKTAFSAIVPSLILIYCCWFFSTMYYIWRSIAQRLAIRTYVLHLALHSAAASYSHLCTTFDAVSIQSTAHKPCLSLLALSPCKGTPLSTPTDTHTLNASTRAYAWHHTVALVGYLFILSWIPNAHLKWMYNWEEKKFAICGILFRIW